MLHDWTKGYALRAGAGPVPLGEDDLLGAPPRDSSSVGWTPHLLTVGVRDGTGHVVRLWLVRRRSRFSARDRALLGLVAPALERLLRERPTPAAPLSLTAQERRVLRMVAAGLSNAEIAERLCVALATVRKHLENAYRKLGVTNRLAAVCALEGRRPTDLAVDSSPERRARERRCTVLAHGARERRVSANRWSEVPIAVACCSGTIGDFIGVRDLERVRAHFDSLGVTLRVWRDPNDVTVLAGQRPFRTTLRPSAPSVPVWFGF